MAELSFYIDGQLVNPPLNARELAINGNWINGSIQPMLTNADLVWVNKAAELIRANIEAGNIFKALPFKMVAVDEVDGSQSLYEGYLDTANGFENVRDASQLATGVYRPEDLDLLNKRLEALSYGYLKDKKLITKSDYTIVKAYVHRTDTSIDDLFTVFGVFVMVKEIVQLTNMLADIISDPAAALGGTIAAPGFTVKMAVHIIMLAAELAFLVISLVKMLTQIGDIVAGRYYNVYGMTFRTMLEKPLKHLGLKLQTNISEVDKIVYLPSRSQLEKKKGDGIPNMQDYGYRCSELFNMVLEMFNAQIKVDSGTVYIYSEGDQFWVSQAKYVLPNILRQNYKYNAEEAVSTKFYSFDTDMTDDYTVELFTGTNLQVDLENNTGAGINDNLLKGFKEFRWPVALGNNLLDSKVKLPFFELLKSIDNVFAMAGIRKPFQKKLDEANGLMIISGKYFSKPKLVVADSNGYIPVNHRSVLSAKSLYSKYHAWSSIAGNGQKRIYHGIKVPFGLKHYLQLLDTNYFSTSSGEIGQITSLNWNAMDNEAVIDFYIRSKYTDKISEKLTEG